MAFSKEDEAGTIYENTSAAGQPYLKLTIRGQKFIAYRNKFKKEQKHPDWNVYIDKPREGDQRHGIEPVAAPAASSDIPW